MKRVLGSKGQVREYRAPDDNRFIALFVPGDFDDFLGFPPFLNSEEELRHLREAYQVRSPEVERSTKAHLTEDELPLQIVILQRPPGSKVNPHYHLNDHPSQSRTRHQLMVCFSGHARIGIYTKDGIHLDTVDLRQHDMVLVAEGHSIEFVEPGTRLIEIKMGPFPGSDAADKVDIRLAG